MFVMHLKTLLSLIQLKFESVVPTLICEISFQIASSVEKEIVKRSFTDMEKLTVNQKVRKVVHKLGDTTIMVKLSEGDMIATEAMRHAKCLVKCNNRCRHRQLNVPGENNNENLAIRNSNS